MSKEAKHRYVDVDEHFRFFKSRVKIRMHKKGFKRQKDLVAGIKELYGKELISEKRLSYILNSGASCNSEDLIILSTVLGCSTDYLLGIREIDEKRYTSEQLASNTGLSKKSIDNLLDITNKKKIEVFNIIFESPEKKIDELTKNIENLVLGPLNIKVMKEFFKYNGLGFDAESYISYCSTRLSKNLLSMYKLKYKQWENENNLTPEQKEAYIRKHQNREFKFWEDNEDEKQ